MASNYLYHMVPAIIYGEKLSPLNMLKERYPESYDELAKKYAGREQLLEKKIEPLHCLWNDVLFFSPVHPKEIISALQDGGFSPHRQQWYEVDPFLLKPSQTIIFTFTPTEEGYHPYKPSQIEQYASLPDITKEYFRSCFTKKDRPFLFNYVPHILFKGELDISSLKVFDLDP